MWCVSLCVCTGVGQAAGLTHDDWTRSILDSESVTDTAHTLEADQLLWSSWKKTATADSRTQRSPNAAMSKSTRSSVTSTCACECIYYATKCFKLQKSFRNCIMFLC